MEVITNRKINNKKKKNKIANFKRVKIATFHDLATWHLFYGSLNMEIGKFGNVVK